MRVNSVLKSKREMIERMIKEDVEQLIILEVPVISLFERDYPILSAEIKRLYENDGVKVVYEDVNVIYEEIKNYDRLLYEAKTIAGAAEKLKEAVADLIKAIKKELKKLIK